MSNLGLFSILLIFGLGYSSFFRGNDFILLFRRCIFLFVGLDWGNWGFSWCFHVDFRSFLTALFRRILSFLNWLLSDGFFWFGFLLVRTGLFSFYRLFDSFVNRAFSSLSWSLFINRCLGSFSRSIDNLLFICNWSFLITLVFLNSRFLDGLSFWRHGSIGIISFLFVSDFWKRAALFAIGGLKLWTNYFDDCWFLWFGHGLLKLGF